MPDDKTQFVDASPAPAAGQPPGERRVSVGPEALKAFAHPLRMALYSELQRLRSSTASGLARALSESSGQTSYHLRQLERFGFVEDDPERSGGRERWWRAVGFDLDSPELFVDPATAASARDVVHRVIAERTHVLTAWAETITPDDDAHVFSTATTDLTPAERTALIDELMAVLDRHVGAVRGRAVPPDAERTRIHLDVIPLASPPGDAPR